MLKGDPEVALAGGGSASASTADPEKSTVQAFAKKKGIGTDLEPQAVRHGATVGESAPNMAALFEKNDFGRALKRN